MHGPSPRSPRTANWSTILVSSITFFNPLPFSLAHGLSQEQKQEQDLSCLPCLRLVNIHLECHRKAFFVFGFVFKQTSAGSRFFWDNVSPVWKIVCLMGAKESLLCEFFSNVFIENASHQFVAGCILWFLLLVNWFGVKVASVLGDLVNGAGKRATENSAGICWSWSGL